MKISANDPKWTAYALGEIKDQQEKAELESILEKSPEIRRLVEEIRNTGDLLSQHLHTEPALRLSQEQRAAIERNSNSGRTWFGLKPGWLVAGAAAAVVLVSIIVVRQLRTTQNPPEQIRAGLPNPQRAPQIETKLPLNPVPAAQTLAPVQPGKFKEFLNKAAATKPKAPPISTPSAEPPPATAVGTPEPGPAAAASPSAPAFTPQSAQNAALGGTITDVTGAVLPGATVKVTDDATGLAAQTTTNAAGQYLFPTLTPGSHTLTAELAGFQTKKLTDLSLTASNPTRLNLNLDVMKPMATTEVSTTAESLLLDSSPSPGMVGQLPPSDSSVADLLKAMGATGGGIGTGRGIGLNQINLQRDGVTIAETGYPTPVSTPPSMDPQKVSQFRMILSPVDAELARSGRGHGPFPARRQPFNTEAYEHISDNAFLDVVQNPLSTFSIDVDTASYSNMRRFLETGKLPPKDSIRIEELVNYFDYDYKGPKDDKPFAANFELTDAPWNPEHKLLRIGLKGREINPGRRPSSNLVFLLDKSGSMQDYNKLPLVKESMRLLVNQLTEADRVAIVIYATDAEVWLPSARGDQKDKIRYAIDRLHADGTTNGASGLQLAYRTAQENFIPGGINRVILATDGDFNTGITNRGDLTRLIVEKAKSGIFFSALGFGMGNLKDGTLEALAKYGHGNYAYIDTLNEAQKVLVEQINSTLVPIAKDVKIQVEFNPRHVSAYRLIGYEDRMLSKEDFNDDTKDAGVIGSGHKVTALYELVPSGIPVPGKGVDPLKYQKPPQTSSSADSNELLTVKIRSKEPEKDRSVLSEFAVMQKPAVKFSDASRDFKFAAAVAAFGMVLRDSPFKGNADLQRVLDWANEGKGEDRYGYRQEFIRLVHRTMTMVF